METCNVSERVLFRAASFQRLLVAGAILLLIATSCGRWPKGVWRPATAGWTGSLVIKRGPEVWLYELSLTGPEGSIKWKGNARQARNELWLNVYEEDGVALARPFQHCLLLEGGSLILKMGGTRVKLQKR